MKEEVAKKLVEALRSGKYKQTRGRLQSTSKVIELGVVVGEERSCFCILGVLCDMFAGEHAFVRWEQATFAGLPTRDIQFVVDSTDEVDGVKVSRHFFTCLPASVVEWAGLQTNDGAFKVTNDMVEELPGEVGKVQALMSLNDDYCWNLYRIADFVEKHWMHI
jgi:hypothetical protein